MQASRLPRKRGTPAPAETRRSVALALSRPIGCDVATAEVRAGIADLGAARAAHPVFKLEQGRVELGAASGTANRHGTPNDTPNGRNVRRPPLGRVPRSRTMQQRGDRPAARCSVAPDRGIHGSYIWGYESALAADRIGRCHDHFNRLGVGSAERGVAGDLRRIGRWDPHRRRPGQAFCPRQPSHVSAARLQREGTVVADRSTTFIRPRVCRTSWDSSRR